MLKKVLECGVAVSVLVLAACGGSVQDVGDASSGSGGDHNMAPATGGKSSSQPQGGSSATGGSKSQGSATGGTQSNGNDDGRGGAAWAPGTCDPPCAMGYGCYEVADDPAGICAPLCDDDAQGQTPDADLSCGNSVRGGAGTCVFSLGFGWPYGGGIEYSNVVTGLCSNSCDPFEQDCPSGYKCDQTATYSAVAQAGLYACVPNKKPHALGEHCESTGDGECGVGSTCHLPEDMGFDAGKCVAFCDQRDREPCPVGQECVETVVTMQDNDPNIGVCL